MPTSSPFALFDDARPGGRALLFGAPTALITCDDAAHVPEALAAIDDAIAQGRHVAGYLAYELGYALEPKLAPLMPEAASPLIWMGVFDAPAPLAQDDLRALMADWGEARADVTLGAPEVERDAYLARVARVRDHIGAGDVYQINYTFAQPFTLNGDPLALYARLRTAQRAGFGAVLATGTRHVLSLSPELFVETDGPRIRTRPMKGTAPRAANPAQDADLQGWLRTDEKSRAENLMIVDLLRNDLGRICQIGTVKAESLFDVERYPTVHQMTSSVEGRMQEGTSLADMVRALFPCGSVTGAPKVKAMEIIRSLETAPRGIYTGAVGYAGPAGARFNVAIRTLDIAAAGPNAPHQGTLGIGSGIVFDSDPAAEWDECHLKAKFLSNPPAPFQLLETLKWSTTEGFALLDRHLERLSRTAAYFGYPCDLDAVQAALDACVAGRAGAWRVRLTVDDWGVPAVGAQPLCEDAAERTWTFALAPEPVDLDSPFTYHKTTHRAFYDAARERLHAETGCDEVVFLNARGEVAEGAITNVFIEHASEHGGEHGGELLTPPVSSGLLAGTLRADLIARGKARESILTRQDLERADRIFLGNSVRGLIPAKLAQK